MKRSKKTFDNLVDSISSLATQRSDNMRQRKKLGLFTYDHDLLRCLHCLLVEDVTSEDRIITYHDDGSLYPNTIDTGLRFKLLGQQRYQCPHCNHTIQGFEFGESFDPERDINEVSEIRAFLGLPYVPVAEHTSVADVMAMLDEEVGKMNFNNKSRSK